MSTATVSKAAMSSVRDFRALAVAGSRWRMESARPEIQPATCTITSVQGTLPRYRAVRTDGSTYADARLDLPPERYLSFDGDTMRVMVDPFDPTSVVTTWRYLGRAAGPVQQAPVAAATVRYCRVDRLRPGDVVYGPAGGYDGRAPGYTVLTVAGAGSPVTIHTREGWPLRYAPWVTVAMVPAVDAGRCETVKPAPATAGPTRIYLGVNDAGWINRPELADIPKCISRNRLAKVKRLPRSRSLLLIDSGGFTELKNHGRWRLTAAQYVAELRVQVDQLGRDQVVAIAPQDWMCETVVIEGGKTKDGAFVGTRRFVDPDGTMTLDEVVHEHQRRTVANFIELRRLAPDLPIFPVLQGQTEAQYLRHSAMYTAAGVRFLEEPLVGLGSVCRRQGTRETERLVKMLAAHGLRLHGFGVGVKGLALYGRGVASVDSNAWSFNGRLDVGLCPHGLVKWEQNCPEKARKWWYNAHATLAGAPVLVPMRVAPEFQQLELFAAA